MEEKLMTIDEVINTLREIENKNPKIRAIPEYSRLYEQHKRKYGSYDNIREWDKYVYAMNRRYEWIFEKMRK